MTFVKGYRQTDEHRKKIAESHRGKSPSEETRRKLRAAKQKENHPNWKGGLHKDSEGYIHVKMRNHPRADRNGYVRRSILVWEQHHGPVPVGMVIHYVNGNPQDDRIENLKALPHGEHVRLHKRGCDQPREIGKFTRYGNVVVTHNEKGLQHVP